MNRMNIDDIDRDRVITEAYREKERRENLYDLITMGKGGFWEYCKYMDSGFFIDEKFILKDLSMLLEKVFHRIIKRLIISFPPRNGKSYTVSQLCAWALGRVPDGCIMRNTNTDRLALKFSYDIKNIIKSKLHRDIFNLEMSSHRYGDDAWALKTSKEYSYFCAGVGGTITGLGANLFSVIDDHVKNMKESTSKTIMDSHFEWYLSTHDTRAERDCPEIIIGTRWSPNDIIGRILEVEKDAIDKGEIVNVVYPALDDNNQSFCEAMEPTASFMRKRERLKNHGYEHIWNAVYQQNPKPSEDVVFKLEELQFCSPLVIENRQRASFGYADPADKGKDFFCSVIGYMIKNGGIYIHDVIYTRKPIEHTCIRVADQIGLFLPQEYTIESNFEGRGFMLLVKELLKKTIKVESLYPAIAWKKNSTNKITRILMNEGKIRNNIYFRSDYKRFPEYMRFINDLTGFDKRKTDQIDDAPDTLAGVVSKYGGGVELEVYSY